MDKLVKWPTMEDLQDTTEDNTPRRIVVQHQYPINIYPREPEPMQCVSDSDIPCSDTANDCSDFKSDDTMECDASLQSQFENMGMPPHYYDPADVLVADPGASTSNVPSVRKRRMGHPIASSNVEPKRRKVTDSDATYEADDEMDVEDNNLGQDESSGRYFVTPAHQNRTESTGESSATWHKKDTDDSENASQF